MNVEEAVGLCVLYKSGPSKHWPLDQPLFERLPSCRLMSSCKTLTVF